MLQELTGAPEVVEAVPAGAVDLDAPGGTLESVQAPRKARPGSRILLLETEAERALFLASFNGMLQLLQIVTGRKCAE